MRIAAIGLCDPGYSEKVAAEQQAASVERLKLSITDVVDAGLQPDERRSLQAITALAKQHAEKPFDALFLVQAAWARPAVLLQIIRAFPVLPMVLYSPGSPIVNGLIRSIAPAAGACASLPILRRHEIKFKYAFSAPGAPIAEEDFMPFLRAAAASRKMLGAKLLMIGFGDMRLQATGFDVQEVHETFGVEVESRDMLELQKEMDSLDRKDVAQQIEQLTANWVFEGRNTRPEALQKVVAMFLVLDRWAQECGYVGLSIKCPTGVAAHLGITPCLVGCLLAGKYHYVCENDIPGLLGQVILGFLSDQMSAYWEFYEVLSDAILFGCCGFAPESFLREGVRVRVFEGFMTGLACCSRIKNGPYTVVRLGKLASHTCPAPRGSAGAADGLYRLACAEGVAADPPTWCEDCLGEGQHPSVLFKPDGLSVAEFMRGALAQHVAVVPGSWAEALDEFKIIKGIG
ncbi:MAG: hypothetical protein HYV35_07815 [Lentisphaerae bacterium]|nr:hypothetical protein [Lentisphaerota bacterium]